MTDISRELTLGQAANEFLSTLKEDKRESAQQAIYRFMFWYGKDRYLHKMIAQDVSKYSDQFSNNEDDISKKVAPVRDYLRFCQKEGLTHGNMASHIKIRKKTASSKKPKKKRNEDEKIEISQEGYNKLKAEIEELKEKRIVVIGEINKAAADKDFRENAPLHAAKERYGYIEGKLKELEGELKKAKVLEGNSELPHVCLGDMVSLCDLSNGEQISYTLVNAREVNIAKGKISCASPIGSQLINKTEGDTVKINTPSGVMSLKIDKISR